MNQSPMIHAPSKKTDEVDWATPLKRYIHTTYQEDPEKYADECMTIHRLRQDMRGAGKDLTGRDLLYRYYGQLELLDLRFPVDESHIRVSFTWYDAFTLKTTSQFSLAYEKASTIFNIASVLSAIAASQNRFESDGLKRASTYFQASAGMYAYINDNFLHAPSTDLSREVVKLLSQLMLTQAQECYLELSIGAKKTFALVAKLASQAGWSYGNIVENMTDFVNKSIFDKSWLSLCQIKHKYISSISQYQKALACEADRQYGECVARLNVADTLAKEASKLANSFVSSFSPSSTQTLMPDAASSLQELTKANAAMIAEKKNSATNDNDIIYNEAVPQESVLTPIDKINAVKSISIQELYNANDIKKVIGPDMFQRLIPFSVHESASLYSEEKAKIVRGETERCDLANTELETSLIDMKLPGMLEKFKSTNSAKSLDELAIPTPEVCEWADCIRDDEINKIPINELRGAVEDLKNNKAKQMLDDISHILDAEQRACEDMRVKYVDEWTQATSGPLTSFIRNDLRKHRENLDKAETNDRHFAQMLEQCMNDISILSGGANGDRLETTFAEALASISNDTPAVNGKRASDNILDIDNVQPEESMPSKVRQIEECIGNLNKVRKERMDTLSDLKEKTHQDDISHLLILNKKTQNIEPQLFQTELEKFIPYKNRITASIHQQQKLLHQLNAFHRSLMEGDEARAVQSRWEQAERKRKEVVERFRKAKDTYIEVKEGIRKGFEFYNDLSESINNLLKTANNFADERQKERDNLVRTIADRQQQKLREDLRHSSAMSPPEQAFRRLSLQQLPPQAHLQTSMQQPPPQAHLQANLQHMQQQPHLMHPSPPQPLQHQPPLSQHQQPPPPLLQHQQPPPPLSLQHQQSPQPLSQQQPPPPPPLPPQHHHQQPLPPPQHLHQPPSPHYLQHQGGQPQYQPQRPPPQYVQPLQQQYPQQPPQQYPQPPLQQQYPQPPLQQPPLPNLQQPPPQHQRQQPQPPQHQHQQPPPQQQLQHQPPQYAYGNFPPAQQQGSYQQPPIRDFQQRMVSPTGGPHQPPNPYHQPQSRDFQQHVMSPVQPPNPYNQPPPHVPSYPPVRTPGPLQTPPPPQAPHFTNDRLARR